MHGNRIHWGDTGPGAAPRFLCGKGPGVASGWKGEGWDPFHESTGAQPGFLLSLLTYAGWSQVKVLL